MTALHGALVFLPTAFVYIAIAGFRRWAVRHMLDVPTDRSSHNVPTPRGAGLWIVVSVLGGLVLACAMQAPALDIRLVLWYASGSIPIALVSWADDVRTLPAAPRLLVHVLGCLILTAGVASLRGAVSTPATTTAAFVLVVLLACFWTIALTNVYNFMDGIDGLAGGQAVLAGVGWAAIGYLIGEPFLTVLGTLVAGASLGFLGHNWPPARVFMGDVGSAFLGYTLGALSVVAVLDEPRLAVPGVLLVWPFLFDTTFTLVRRVANHENVFTAHRTHLYQRLLAVGYSHLSVTLVYLSLAAVGALLALWWVMFLPGYGVLTLSLPVLLFAGLWASIVHVEGGSHHAPKALAKDNGPHS